MSALVCALFHVVAIHWAWCVTALQDLRSHIVRCASLHQNPSQFLRNSGESRAMSWRRCLGLHLLPGGHLVVLGLGAYSTLQDLIKKSRFCNLHHMIEALWGLCQAKVDHFDWGLIFKITQKSLRSVLFWDNVFQLSVHSEDVLCGNVQHIDCNMLQPSLQPQITWIWVCFYAFSLLVIPLPFSHVFFPRTYMYIYIYICVIFQYYVYSLIDLPWL